MSKFALLLLFVIPISACNSGSGTNGAAGPVTLRLNCSTIPELDACWQRVVVKTRDCFFFVPGYSASTDTLGAFNTNRTSCSHGSKRVDFSPAVTGDGLFPTETVDASLTFYNAGNLCLRVVHTANSSNYRIATYSDSSGTLYRLEPTSTGVIRYCDGKKYEAGPTELAEIQSQCPTIAFSYKEGNGQAGASPNPTSIHYYFGDTKTQEIACQY